MMYLKKKKLTHVKTPHYLARLFKAPTNCRSKLLLLLLFNLLRPLLRV